MQGRTAGPLRKIGHRLSTTTILAEADSVVPVPRLSVAQRLRRGVSWTLAGAVANSGLNLVLNVLLARVLGKHGFGEFAIVQSTMLTVSGVAQLATGYTANKYIAEFHTVDKERTARGIGFCSIVSIATAVLGLLAVLSSAKWVAVHRTRQTGGVHEFVGRLRARRVFAVFSGFLMGVLAGLESFRELAKGLAVGAVGNTLVVLVGARLGGDSYSSPLRA